MKKTAIIGIGIAIVIAGIVGIYAVSTTQEGESAKAGGGVQAEIDQAEDFLDDGDTLRIAGQFKDAIDKYKDAQDKAEDAFS